MPLPRRLRRPGGRAAGAGVSRAASRVPRGHRLPRRSGYAGL